MLKKILQRIRCKHDNLYTVTNVYGDSINMYDCRSIRQCKNCGKKIFHNSLDTKCNRVNEFDYKE